MAEPVIERPPFMPPPTSGDPQAMAQWAVSFTQLMSWIFQQYGYRLNLSVATDGTVSMTGPLPLMSYTTAERPDATAYEGSIIYVSDGAAGSRFQGSDGASWVSLG